MSHFQKIFTVNIAFILFLFGLKIKVFGDKIEQSIYKKLTGNEPCVTLLNATHQIGCTSKRKGNVGVVHYIDSEKSFKWLLNNGNHAPYIPLFAAEYFTDARLKQLVNADKVSGALVLYDPTYEIDGTKPPSQGLSPEYPCPNENFGLYSSHETYSCSSSGNNSVIWNKNGSGMLYRDNDVPVFALYNENEINSLIRCYNDHNKPVNDTNPDYPLCGVELLSFMFAAKDTPTCMRKNNAPTFTQNTFCDPLGDRNVWGTLFPLFHDNITKNDIILATAKLDSTAFFHRLAFGADNDATGVIVLLAAAEALGNLKRNGSINAPDLEKNQKHIMFSFFQGEVWDYIGSSRMVYDMTNGDFPCYGNGSCRLPSFDLSNIAYYLELNQVGKQDEEALWAHRDPESSESVRNETRKMFDILYNFGASMNLSIKDPSQSKLQPLPPASFQRFLKKNRTIPGLVITDHNVSYTNKFYNSRFDDYQNLDISNVSSSGVKHLTSLATTVAKTLYKLAYNETRNDINVTGQQVYDLMRCFLGSRNCSIFKQVLTEKKAEKLNTLSKLYFNRYVGPFEKKEGPAFMTVITRYFLAYFTGIHNVTCIFNNETNYYVFKGKNETCIGAPVYFSPAQSPAFLLKDYDSTEYSTWTESRWGSDVGIRMFLIADPTQEAITLAVGIVLTLISLLVTVFMYMKAEQLFTPNDCVLVVNDDMQ